MTHTLQAPFSPWWLFAPPVLLFLLLFLAIRWRRFLVAAFAAASIVIASATTIASCFAYSRLPGAVRWGALTTGDGWRTSLLCLEFRRGGVCFFLDRADFGTPLTKTQTGKILAQLVAHPYATSYPGFARFSLIKSNFLQNTLGFQLCWHSGPDPDGSGQVVALYSITTPQWFLLALSLIPPAWWLNRHLAKTCERRRGFPIGEPANSTADSLAATPNPRRRPPPRRRPSRPNTPNLDASALMCPAFARRRQNLASPHKHLSHVISQKCLYVHGYSVHIYKTRFQRYALFWICNSWEFWRHV